MKGDKIILLNNRYSEYNCRMGTVGVVLKHYSHEVFAQFNGVSYGSNKNVVLYIDSTDCMEFKKFFSG
jgi:hypothetical protein